MQHVNEALVLNAGCRGRKFSALDRQQIAAMDPGEVQRILLSLIQGNASPAAQAVSDAFRAAWPPHDKENHLAQMANIQDSGDGNAVPSTSAAARSRVPDLNEDHCAKAGPSAIKRGGGAAEWTEGQTKLLLEYYYKYFPQIGPFKKFKNRKQAFKQISKDIEEVLGITKTAEQCENRYKPVIRRRKSAADSNNKSGASPCPVPFDDEIRKIQSIDDSIEPEVQRDALGASCRELSATPVASASSREPRGTPGNFATSSMEQPVTPGTSTTSNEESTDGSETGYLQPAKTGACRTNTTSLRHMHMYFAEMRAIQEERAARKAAKEVKKEEQRAERRAERQCALEERRRMHEEKMNILREVLQLRK